jgi:hypothetical protein
MNKNTLTNSEPNSSHKLANFLFSKSGFADALKLISDKIEDDIAGQYEAIDTNEDSLAPSYGALCYTTFLLISDGKIDRDINYILTKTQSNLLKELAENNTIKINACRDDWLKHEYSFIFSVPMTPKNINSEKFNIYYDISFSKYSTYHVDIKVDTDEGIEEADIEKILLMYALNY